MQNLLRTDLSTVPTQLNIPELRTSYCHGQEMLSSPFHYCIHVVSPRKFNIENLLNQAITLEINTPQANPTRYVNGMVEQVSWASAADSMGHHYQLILVPSVLTLDDKARSRIFHQQSVIDVALTILQDSSAIHYRTAITKHYAKQSTLVQYQETDWHFIQRILADAGLFYYFKHDRYQHTLFITDSTTSCTTITLQKNQFITNYTFQTHHIVLQLLQPYWFAGLIISVPDNGTASNHYLIENMTMTLTDYSNACYPQPLPASQQARQTTHCLSLATPYQPSNAIHTPRIYGLLTATVVANTVPMMQRKEHLLTIQYAWKRTTQHVNDYRALATLKQIASGDGWGTQFIPSINDTVLVIFREGKLEHPVIIGCLYRQASDIPLPLPQHASCSGIKYSLTQFQHQRYQALIFDDAANRASMQLHAANHYHVTVTGQWQEHIDNDLTVRVNGNDYHTHICQGEHRLLATNIHLQTGASTLSITASGIHINARTITLRTPSSNAIKPIARDGDLHSCPMSNPSGQPHVGGSISSNCSSVCINHAAPARLGDHAQCQGSYDQIIKGSSCVFINGRPAVYQGAQTLHGGTVVQGSPDVFIAVDDSS